MWGFLIGLYIAVIISPFIEEWLEKRANKSALTKRTTCLSIGVQILQANDKEATTADIAAWGIAGTQLKGNGWTSSRALAPLG